MVVKPPPSADFDEICARLAPLLKLSPITIKILVSRGIVDEAQARAFLVPSLREHIPDPHAIKNIEPAADMILDAVGKRERITVYCDFDVDGTSAGAQLFLYLKALGANVGTYTPSRFVEGYGLVPSAVEKLASTGTKLLVTADCGINSHAELKLARKLGLRTIVLDHHLPNGEAPADIVVDPAQEGCPFQEYKLAAAGLVWMLLIVLRRRAAALIEQGKLKLPAAPPDPKDYLDLAVLGTVCDMVPLTGLNRVIASRGIEALKRSTRPGIAALKHVAGVASNPKFGAGHVAFNLGPRINAAGRLGDANDVIELLTTADSLKAKTIAERIDRLNEKRKAIEEDVRSQCVEQILSGGLADQPAFALFGETFHVGVIGIAAQRVVDQFYRPAAVMAPGETTIRGKTVKIIKGSVRSIRGFHVADALHQLAPLLLSGGGHAEAGGFSVLPEKMAEFAARFVEIAGEVLSPEQLERKRMADVEVALSQISYDLVNELGSLAPFGVGNPSPLLVANGVMIESVSSLSAGHLKLLLRCGTAQVVGMAWSMQGHPLLKKGGEISIAFIPELNSYRGITSVQLNIQEIW